MSGIESTEDLETVLATFWAKAREAKARGDSVDERTWLEGIVDLDENDVEAWLALARLVVDPREQMLCYSHVLELSPGNGKAKQGLREARRRAR